MRAPCAGAGSEDFWKDRWIFRMTEGGIGHNWELTTCDMPLQTWSTALGTVFSRKLASAIPQAIDNDRSKVIICIGSFFHGLA